MSRWMAGLVVVGLAAAPAAAQDDKAADVIRKAIDAHGGADALNKYPANESRMTGKMSFGGVDMSLNLTMKATVPDKVKLDIGYEVMGQKGTIVQVVNGDKVRQTQDGKPTKLTEAQEGELRQMGAAQEVSMLTPLLKPKYTLTADKDADVGGKPAAVVRVQAKGLKDLRLFFDRGTGLLTQMERQGLDPTGKAVTETTTFEDYKKVQGVQVPMKSVVNHDGKPFMTLTVTEYKPLEKIADAEFTLAD